MMKKKLTAISISILLLVAIMAARIIIFRPDQFADEVDDTAGKIPSDTFNLVIYTDIHHDPAYEVDPWLETLTCIQSVSWKSRIDAFWNLGDIINGYNTTKKEAIAQIREVTAFEDRISPNFHRIPGNHDNNIQSTYETNAAFPKSEVLTSAELHTLLANNHSSQVEYHNEKCSTDYYVDFPKLRVVCISADNTTFLPETAEWLESKGLKTNLPVLILSHIPTRPEWGFHNDVINGELIEAELKKFCFSGGTIIAYIYGHDHGDMVSVVTDENGGTLWNEICVACSRFHLPQSNSTSGMTFWERNCSDMTMVIFDVASIDLEEKIVRLIRFGAGEDREILF